MTTATIRIKETVTTPDDVTTHSCTKYWHDDWDGMRKVITPGEEIDIDAADLAAHVATGLVEEVTP